METKNYNASEEERKILELVKKRKDEMQAYRKSLKIEDKWKEADSEYIPSEIKMESNKTIFETDDELGLRTKLTKVNPDSNNWRSDVSDPTLLVKIQTALSIIIERNPEAFFVPMSEQYDKRTALANSLWKRSWEVANSKEVIKLFAFNLAKYGWAAGLTSPLLIKYKKKILTEYNADHPEKNKYDEVENVLYNDLARRNLNPWRTWVDENSRPYDLLSTNECYYELDYSYDQAKIEFGKYKNFDFVPETGAKEVADGEPDRLERNDIVTIGFYENKLKDIYACIVPSANILLYTSPLPNDDGIVSIWHAPWIIRSAESPYGISLWEIIRQDKELYDKMKNMTMDQLVLSIIKMFFYTGSSNLFGDGKIEIKPGKGVQITNGDVKWMEVPTPGAEAWKGLDYIKNLIDDNSGVTPTLEGGMTGKTLGEVLHAKEAALKRLRLPLENICWAIEQDAYLSLSWMKQIYSTPEVKSFANMKDLMDYEEEMKTKASKIVGAEGITSLEGVFYPKVALHASDRNGQLYESKDSRYFQIGKDIKISDLNWKGIIKVIPTSIVSPSEELEKQRKIEIFNILAPILPGDPSIFGKSATQLLKVNNEDPKDWLPDSWINEGTLGQESLFIQGPQQMVPADGMTGNGQYTAGGNETLQAENKIKPNQGAPTVVPGNMTSVPQVSGFTSDISKMK